MSATKPVDTALSPPWSLADYLKWQREAEERDQLERDSINRVTIEREDTECEAAVLALEEGWGIHRPR